MRRLLTLCIICAFLIGGALAKEDESYLIRRAYVDVLGIVPTAEEIDWFCVYNNDSYQLAIEWILQHPSYKWDEVKGDAKTYLHSDLYKTLKKMPISKKRMDDIILYVAGDTHETTEENVQKSKKKIINHAINSSLDDVETIDYICYRLMSRVTHLNEANYLVQKLKEFRKTKSQDESWLELFNEILLLEDVKCR